MSSPSASLRRGGHRQQPTRFEVVEKALVGRRLGVVELVDDHHVETGRIESVGPEGGQRLDRREDVAAPVGALAADQQLPEGAVPHCFAERSARLAKDLFTVRDKQQGEVAVLSRQPAVVESRDNRLAGAGRCHDEVVA